MMNTQTVLCLPQDTPAPLYYGFMGALSLESDDPDFDPFKTILRAFILFGKYRQDLTICNLLEHAIEALNRVGYLAEAETLQEARDIVADDTLTYLLLGINGDSATPIDIMHAALDINPAREKLRRLRSGRARSIVLNAAFLVTGAAAIETESSQELSKAATAHALFSIRQLSSLRPLHPAAVLAVAIEVTNQPEVLLHLTTRLHYA